MLCTLSILLNYLYLVVITELSEYLKDAAEVAVKKVIGKTKGNVDDEEAVAAAVSEMLSESLRARKLRQWEQENKINKETKGSLAEIGQRDHHNKKNVHEYENHHIPSKVDTFKKSSLMEKKKRQWMIEKGLGDADEGNVINDWFGKPGAGAPIRGEGGDVLTQYGAARASDVKNAQESLASTYNLKTSPKKYNIPGLNVVSTARDTSRYAVVVEPGKIDEGEAPPAAMRSAFASGAAPPDEHRYDSVREKEKKAWLDELKRQMEEKQEQKAKERQMLDAYYRADDAPAQNQYSSRLVDVPKKQIMQVEYDKKNKGNEAKVI